jgi:hypothetical protein
MNSHKPPSKDFARENVQSRRLGKRQKCTICGEDRPAALIAGSVPRICAECKRRAEGKSQFDHHHVAGQNNHSGTISIPVNDHVGRLSLDQYEWPRKTLRNPDRSPLLIAAACIRGAINVIEYCVDVFLRGVAALLELLDEALTAIHGRFWWKKILPTWKGFENYGRD